MKNGQEEKGLIKGSLPSSSSRPDEEDEPTKQDHGLQEQGRPQTATELPREVAEINKPTKDLTQEEMINITSCDFE